MKLIDKRKFVKELEKYQWQTPKDIPMLINIRNCLNASEIEAIPLKDLPHYEYMSPRYIAEEPSDDYFNGWNDCLNEILKEEE